MYIATLPADRRADLKEELAEFIGLYEHSSDVREAWLGLGAEAWQHGLDIREGLRGFLEMM